MKKVWNFLRSMTFGMILLGLVLLCSLAGSLIAQGNPAAWYVETYPNVHGLLLRLELDHVFTSWYFISLLVLLCVNLTLCSLVRILRLARAAKTSAERTADLPVERRLTREGLEKLKSCLEEKHCRKTVVGARTVYQKNMAGWYGSFVTHLAILLTVAVGAAAIYLPVVTDETCMPGESLRMADGAEISVESFHIEDETGALDYASVIRVTLPDGRESGSERISVNHPLSFGEYKIYQQTYGTAGKVTVHNTQTGGEDVFSLTEMCFLSLDGTNGIWFEALYPGYLRDEEGNFTLITQTSGRYEDPVYQVLLASDGVYTPVMAFPGETVSVAGIDFTFEEPVEYPGLRIKKTPEGVNALLCAVFVLMVVGLWLCFFTPPVLVAVDEEGYAVGGPKPQGLRLELEALLGEEFRRDEEC